MGIQLRKLMRSRVIVVFGATSRIGRSAMEVLAAQEQVSVALVAAVENTKDPRVLRLKHATNCFLVQCNFAQGGKDTLRRVVRNADAVLLVPALSESGVRFSRRVVDAVAAEQVLRLVVISSILASPELLGRCRQEHAKERPATEAVGSTPTEVTALEGFEAVEVHARAKLPEQGRCVSLRIPLLMETLLYCRDELLFANRFIGCFGSDTHVPCISVRDVGYAAAEVLANPKRKYEMEYRLTGGTNASCSPHELALYLTGLLGREIKYRKMSDAGFLRVMREKHTPEQVAQGTVGLRIFLEEAAESEARGKVVTTQGRQGEPHPLHLPDAFRSTSNFRVLTKRERMTPRQWLQRHAALLFGKNPQNQVQLFVVGSGEALFLEVSKFVASQITAPSAIPPSDVGESAIPTVLPGHHQRQGVDGGLQQAKVTLCTVKAAPGSSGQTRSSGVPLPPTVYQLEGAPPSPMGDLLKQLSSLDVVLLIPPLRLGGRACLDVVRAVVHAAVRANAWGVVLVSSIFVGSPTKQQSAIIEQLEEIESCVKTSGVSYTIVRLPLFMEYFLALSHCEESSESMGSVEEEKHEVPPVDEGEFESDLQAENHEEGEAGESPAPTTMWPLLEPSLASARVYFMALEDAAKVLVAAAFTFPLHRGKTKELYTSSSTMKEVQRTLQRHANKARPVRLSRVDALREQPGREFWRVAYWPRAHTQQFLECAVEFSKDVQIATETSAAVGGSVDTTVMVLPVSQSFEDLTDLTPLTLDQWAELNSKRYTQVLSAHHRVDE
ncbi:NAD(P)-binding domain [Phytophthora cinnamomi]|uniref:NAD(P)-binding domain n=1 Tax=Phytophthora cinnamomi TaxID=4785 RepID=UPI003559B428|nr:NAD(P)-binding domain [Phytophthora cinnamomi]